MRAILSELGGTGGVGIEGVQTLEPYFSKPKTRARWAAQVESELKELDPEEAAEYLESLGATEGGLGSLVRATCLIH